MHSAEKQTRAHVHKEGKIKGVSPCQMPSQVAHRCPARPTAREGRAGARPAQAAASAATAAVAARQPTRCSRCHRRPRGCAAAAGGGGGSCVARVCVVVRGRVCRAQRLQLLHCAGCNGTHDLHLLLQLAVGGLQLNNLRRQRRHAESARRLLCLKLLMGRGQLRLEALHLLHTCSKQRAHKGLSEVLVLLACVFAPQNTHAHTRTHTRAHTHAHTHTHTHTHNTHTIHTQYTHNTQKSTSFPPPLPNSTPASSTHWRAQA